MTQSLPASSDFASALDGLSDALPLDVGDLTGAIDGDLAQFPTLIQQLQDVLQDSVRVAGAVERLVAIDFSWPFVFFVGQASSPLL